MEPTAALRSELARATRAGRSEPPCSYRQFLERYVVIPDGKSKGLRFRADRQPVQNLWIDAIDSGQFTEFYFTAPSQFGKTLIAFVGPLLWHTCERSENFVLGVPFADMAANKWELDVLPVIESSPQLRRLKPVAGAGSAGGKIRDMVTLRNGVAIKLMSAGAQDTGKAGFTSRVLGVTEAAAFSTAGESSVEADPLRQLRARQRSYKEHERTTYVEGTVTLETDLPWRIKPFSTDSRIMTPCPKCSVWIAPERDDLIGWDGAKTENEAGQKAMWSCPECGECMTEDERRQSLMEAKLVHRGQSVDPKTKEIIGPAPETSRLFFRANAFHNLFLDADSIGRDEWRASQIPEDSLERHSADRELCQFVHCIPYVEPMFAEDLQLDKKAIASRRLQLPERVLPSDTKWLTIGCDMGERRAWWLALATRELPSVEDLATRNSPLASYCFHVAAYGEVEVPSDKMPLEQAIQHALRAMHELFQAGFLVDGLASRRIPDQVWYDANFQPGPVLSFIRQVNEEKFSRQDKHSPWLGSFGRGVTSMAKARYNAPRKTGNIVRDVDPSGLWYVERHAKSRTHVVLWDSDSSKWQVQQAMTRVPWLDPHDPNCGQTPGSVTLFAGTPKIHERFTSHIYNERLETVRTIRGETRHWVRHGANHLLDCFAAAYRAVPRAEHIAAKQIYVPATEPVTKTAEKPAASRRSWYESED